MPPRTRPRSKSRKSDVEQNPRKVAPVFPDQTQRDGPIGRLENRAGMSAQGLDGGDPKRRLVFDHENKFPSIFVQFARQRCWRRWLDGLMAESRMRNVVPCFASVSLNSASYVVHDSVHDREPQTMARRFRGEEWIKNSGSYSCVDSATAVGHCELDIAVGPPLGLRARHAARSDLDHSILLTDRVSGVGHEVHNKLPELGGVGLYNRQA